MPANTKPKELPTIRDTEDVYQRETREIIRQMQAKLKELEARVYALENP